MFEQYTNRERHYAFIAHLEKVLKDNGIEISTAETGRQYGDNGSFAWVVAFYDKDGMLRCRTYHIQDGNDYYSLDLCDKIAGKIMAVFPKTGLATLKEKVSSIKRDPDHLIRSVKQSLLVEGYDIPEETLRAALDRANKDSDET